MHKHVPAIHAMVTVRVWYRQGCVFMYIYVDISIGYTLVHRQQRGRGTIYTASKLPVDP